MEKISGLVLDMYDDVNGALLKSMYPTHEQLPEIVKSAAAIDKGDLDRLPDDVFALVLTQGDTRLRKYACIDAGHTALNIGYLMATHHKLPVEAVKVAASNLITACGWYDIEPPDELKKLSSGDIPVIGRQRVWKDSEGVTYGTDGQHWDLQKTAEASGTADMPAQLSKGTLASKSKPLSVPKTAAEMTHLVDSPAKGDEDTILEQAFGIKGEAPASFPQVKTVLTPHVDVTDKEPPRLIEEKKAHFFALPSQGMYPLDGFDQVKAASAYFDQYRRQMEPGVRHEYAVNLVKRASALGVEVSKEASWYGQESFAPYGHTELCIQGRLNLVSPHMDGFNEEGKTASAHVAGLYSDLLGNWGRVDPEVFARTLHEIDKLAGVDEFYDTDVTDPYYTTFGKTAEKDETKDSLVIGNEYMRLEDLKTFAQYKSQMMKKRFGEDFVSEFQKDPVAIFESMPMDQKVVIMHMVNGASETSMS